jgi:hypothetical protein
MNRREKQALDRWITTDPRGAECETCEGEGTVRAAAEEIGEEPPSPCPVCDWVGVHAPECRLADAETCADCGSPLDPADKDEEGDAGWAYIVEYGDEAYHHSCIETRRRADEKAAHEWEEAWQNDPVAQAQETAARQAAGAITPEDL